MSENPYKFQGPLDLKKDRDKLVCAPRKDDVAFIIERIRRGEYVTIQGPQQIGKTTLLFLVMNQFKHANYAYINFEVAPGEKGKEKAFYKWLIDQLKEKIPCEKSKFNTITGEYPDASFIDFLKKFKPTKDKIILLFDEINRLNFLKGFLHVWRNLYHESFVNKKMQKYTIITTSSKDLLRIPIGPNSPFNITNTLNIKDLPGEESEEIIDKPFNKLKINISKEAKQKLLSKISGHPQLLQHACYLLVDKAKEKTVITKNDVDEAIGRLFTDNSVLKTLKMDIETDQTLNNLVKEILKTKRDKVFHPYSEFALLGAGAIKEENKQIKIRNAVYKKFIIDILDNPVEVPIPEKFKYHETKEEKEQKEVDISTNFAPNTEKSQPKKRTNLAKILIFTFGILAIALFSISLPVQDFFIKSALIIGSGFSVSLTVGVLISLSPGEKDETVIKSN